MVPKLGGVGGAVAGAVTAATGGAVTAAPGLMASSIGGGALVGAVGSVTGGCIQAAGNTLYFGDPMPTGKDMLTGMAIGAITGGIMGGVSHQIWGKGTNIWTGK